jgi:hypothetical protein
VALRNQSKKHAVKTPKDHRAKPACFYFAGRMFKGNLKVLGEVKHFLQIGAFGVEALVSGKNRGQTNRGTPP